MNNGLGMRFVPSQHNRIGRTRPRARRNNVALQNAMRDMVPYASIDTLHDTTSALQGSQRFAFVPPASHALVQSAHSQRYHDTVMTYAQSQLDEAAPQHGLPVQQHGLPDQQYSLPDQQYGRLDQQHGLPDQQHGLLDQQYGLTNQQHGLPVQQYGMPIQQNGSPVSQTGMLVQQNGMPARSNGVPIHRNSVPVHPNGVPDYQHSRMPRWLSMMSTAGARFICYRFISS